MNEDLKKYDNERFLTPAEKEIFALFFLGFKFSQGRPQTQSLINCWLDARGYLTDIDLPSSAPDYITRLIKPPKRHDRSSDRRIVQENISSEWAKFFTAKAYNKGLVRSVAGQITIPILSEMISADIHYQGRPRPTRVVHLENVIEPDSRHDPHRSFFRWYVLLGHEAGHPAYNHLFCESREVLVGRREMLTNELTRLQDCWSIKHPGHEFWPEDLRV